MSRRIDRSGSRFGRMPRGDGVGCRLQRIPAKPVRIPPIVAEPRFQTSPTDHLRRRRRHKAAIAEVMPSRRQRCRVHFRCNLLTYASRSDQSQVAEPVRSAFRTVYAESARESSETPASLAHPRRINRANSSVVGNKRQFNWKLNIPGSWKRLASRAMGQYCGIVHLHAPKIPSSSVIRSELNCPASRWATGTPHDNSTFPKFSAHRIWNLGPFGSAKESPEQLPLVPAVSLA